MIKKIAFLFLLMLGLGGFCFAHEHLDSVPADEAIEKLKEGNRHFVKMHLKHPDVSKKRMNSLRKGQHPFVAILSCSDSRVPPEIIFDQGLGDIFEIRNAGNILDEHVIGSIEYAVVHLGVKLVVIMGHENCGAVKAACEHVNETAYINSLVSAINPAVEMAKSQKGDLYENAEKNNIKLVAETLLSTDNLIKEYQEKHGVKIVKAYYNIKTGVVDFLE